MHNTESVLENETHRILLDFEIQIDHLILVRRPDLEIVKKKKKNKKEQKKIKQNWRIEGIAVLADRRAVK